MATRILLTLVGFVIIASPYFCQRWDRNAPKDPMPSTSILGENLA